VTGRQLEHWRLQSARSPWVVRPGAGAGDEGKFRLGPRPWPQFGGEESSDYNPIGW